MPFSASWKTILLAAIFLELRLFLHQTTIATRSKAITAPATTEPTMMPTMSEEETVTVAAGIKPPTYTASSQASVERTFSNLIPTYRPMEEQSAPIWTDEAWTECVLQIWMSSGEPDSASDCDVYMVIVASFPGSARIMFLTSTDTDSTPKSATLSTSRENGSPLSDPTITHESDPAPTCISFAGMIAPYEISLVFMNLMFDEPLANFPTAMLPSAVHTLTLARLMNGLVSAYRITYFPLI
mmetsp:Transcript_3804/g.10867  ORF Transcript_3804/g.10867 Transcript_3804/m.10867 type:complete len:241 (+) Transcript_3804:1266-1988(+)